MDPAVAAPPTQIAATASAWVLGFVIECARADALCPNQKVEHPNTLRHGGRRVAAAAGTDSFVDEAPSICALILAVATSCAT
jgi:hypothetical protein